MKKDYKNGSNQGTFKHTDSNKKQDAFTHTDPNKKMEHARGESQRGLGKDNSQYDKNLKSNGKSSISTNQCKGCSTTKSCECKNGCNKKSGMSQ